MRARWVHVGQLWTNGEPFLAVDAALRGAWHGYSNDDYDQVVALGWQNTSVPVGAGRAVLAGADGSSATTAGSRSLQRRQVWWRLCRPQVLTTRTYWPGRDCTPPPAGKEPAQQPVSHHAGSTCAQGRDGRVQPAIRQAALLTATSSNGVAAQTRPSLPTMRCLLTQRRRPLSGAEQPVLAWSLLSCGSFGSGIDPVALTV